MCVFVWFAHVCDCTRVIARVFALPGRVRVIARVLFVLDQRVMFVTRVVQKICCPRRFFLFCLPRLPKYVCVGPMCTKHVVRLGPHVMFENNTCGAQNDVLVHVHKTCCVYGPMRCLKTTVVVHEMLTWVHVCEICCVFRALCDVCNSTALVANAMLTY